jgi:hypothetical protein
LKDDRYGRAEEAGLKQALAGMCAMTESDLERLANGAQMFEWLCAALRIRTAGFEPGRDHLLM